MQRLVLNSLMANGEFARFHFEQILDTSGRLFDASFKSAQDAGDVATGVSTRNAFWFAHHMAVMLGNTHLPKERAVKYGGKEEEVIRQAVTFMLRGLGMKEAVIQKKYDSKALMRLVRADDKTGATAGSGLSRSLLYELIAKGKIRSICLKSYKGGERCAITRSGVN